MWLGFSNLVKSFTTYIANLRTIFVCATLIISIYIGIYIGNPPCAKGITLKYKINVFHQSVNTYGYKTPNLVKSFTTYIANLRTIFVCATLIISIYIGIYIGNTQCAKGLPLTIKLSDKINDVLHNTHNRKPSMIIVCGMPQSKS